MENPGPVNSSLFGELLISGGSVRSTVKDTFGGTWVIYGCSAGGVELLDRKMSTRLEIRARSSATKGKVII